MNPYRGGRLGEQAGRFTMDELIRGQRIAVEAHERLVSSNLPMSMLLEFTLISILRR
jgi:hypothetical protein